MDPCVKDPSNLRLPFIVTYHAAHSVGVPTPQGNMASRGNLAEKARHLRRMRDHFAKLTTLAKQMLGIVLSAASGRSAHLIVKTVAGPAYTTRDTSEDVLSGRVMIAIGERVA